MNDESGYLDRYSSSELASLHGKFCTISYRCAGGGPTLNELNQAVKDQLRHMDANAVITSVCGQTVEVDASAIDQDIENISHRGKIFTVVAESSKASVEYLEEWNKEELEDFSPKVYELYMSCNGDGPDVEGMKSDIAERYHEKKREERTSSPTAVITSVCGQTETVTLSTIDQDIKEITFRGKTFKVSEGVEDTLNAQEFTKLANLDQSLKGWMGYVIDGSYNLNRMPGSLIFVPHVTTEQIKENKGSSRFVSPASGDVKKYIGDVLDTALRPLKSQKLENLVMRDWNVEVFELKKGDGTFIHVPGIEPSTLGFRDQIDEINFPES